MADIQSFLTFTSSQNEDVARQYLEMAGGNLETAVGLYMEMGGAAEKTVARADGIARYRWDIVLMDS